MKKTDSAYTAGIIDGEGCISIGARSKQRENGSRVLWYTMRVTLTSTDEWLCQWLKFAWGGSIYYQEERRKTNQQAKWSWTIFSRQAERFLREILPYLNLKRPQAELAIKFQQDRVYCGHKATDEEKALQEAQRLLISKMKHRGVQEAPNGKAIV